MSWRPWIEWAHPDTHATATGTVLPARYPRRKRKGPRVTEAPTPKQLPLPFEDVTNEENQH